MKLFDFIKNIIVQQLGVDEKDIKPTSRLIDDLGADSLDLMEIVMLIESKLDVEINYDELSTANKIELLTVTDFADFISLYWIESLQNKNI